MTAALSSFLLSFTLLWPFAETKRVCVIYGLSNNEGLGGISKSPPPQPTMAESPTPTPLHFIHFVCPLRLAGKASKSSLYCTQCTQRLGLLSHFLDVPLDCIGGLVGMDANICMRQLLGTTEQSVSGQSGILVILWIKCLLHGFSDLSLVRSATRGGWRCAIGRKRERGDYLDLWWRGPFPLALTPAIYHPLLLFTFLFTTNKSRIT